jgi:hypothetical protein
MMDRRALLAMTGLDTADFGVMASLKMGKAGYKTICSWKAKRGSRSDGQETCPEGMVLSFTRYLIRSG